MLALEWRLTLLALVVLPLFVIPARRVGRRLQDDLPPADAAQRDDEHADDRALQRRRGDARQAVRRPPSARTPRSSATPPACATPASARRCTAGCSSSPSASSARSARRRSTASAATSSCPASITTGHARRPRRARHPRVPAADRAHQRPRRPDDVDGQLRAGLRGARRARGRSASGPAPSTSSRPAGRVTFDDVRFRYPPAAETSIASLEQHPPATDPDRDVLDGVEPRRHAGRDGRPRRRVRRRQVDARLADPPALRRHRRRRAHRRPRRPRPHARLAAGGDRRRRPGPAPVPRVDRRQPALRQARRHRRRARRGVPRGADPRHDRRPARRLRHGRRRARLPPVGRREAAPGDRPAAAQGSGRDDPRRGDEPPRQRQRGAGAGRARDGAVRPHGDRHRPPAVDDPRRRPHRRARRRPHRRARHARRARRPRRPLRRPAPRRRA